MKVHMEHTIYKQQRLKKQKQKQKQKYTFSGFIYKQNSTTKY
jgi:hypothetical protein